MRTTVVFILLMSLQTVWATSVIQSGWCSSFLQKFVRRHEKEPAPEWQRHLEKLGHFGIPQMCVFDRHLVTQIEAMISELNLEQKAKFISTMGLILFAPERSYGGAYYRFWDQVGIELDPNLFGHPMSRLVYIHELRHVSDDIKSGFPPEGMKLDTLKTEAAALGEGYDYMTLVNNDPEYRIGLFPKNDVAVTRAADEDEQTWAKREYDDHFGVDLHAVRKLPRKEYVERTIRAYEEKIRARQNDDIYKVISQMTWGTLFKNLGESKNQTSQTPESDLR